MQTFSYELKIKLKLICDIFFRSIKAAMVTDNFVSKWWRNKVEIIDYVNLPKFDLKQGPEYPSLKNYYFSNNYYSATISE